VLAGLDHDRAIHGELAFATANGMLDQRRGRQIPEDLGASFEALSVKPAMRDPVRHVRKPFLYKTKRRRPVIGLPPHTYALLEGLYARKSCGVKTD
jgi:hypothetical protein